MTDYTLGIGGGTTMMIRDQGGWVEFWVRTGPSTYNYDQQWSYFANGSESGTLRFRMLPGGAWQQFGAVYVGYNQDIRFSLYGAGIGFPTSHFWQHINRTTVPQPPRIDATYAISDTTIHIEFNGTNDGGSVVLEWQIGYGSNPNGPENFVGSGGTSDIGGFYSGQRVYFWTRARNALGWSGWSSRTDATTWRVPDSPTSPVALEVKQTSVKTQFFRRGDGGVDIIEYQMGYGKSSVAPTDFFITNPSGIDTTIGLDPGKVYYFWVRARNSIGWSSWSASSQITLIAGARVLVSNQWVRAVPYVKQGGVWKVARPYIRDAGIWKESGQ